MASLKTIFHSLVLGLVAILFVGPAVSVHAESDVTRLEHVFDLPADARRMRDEGLVMMVFVTQPYCEFCEYVRENHIHPMRLAGLHRNTLIMREIDLTSDQEILDFSGAGISMRQFCKRYGVWLTPTILLLGPTGGELASQLKGVMGAGDYYGYYLNQAIETARRRLSQ